MNEQQWRECLKDWQQRFHINVRPPLARDLVLCELLRLGVDQVDLISLYSTCNGFDQEGVGILPIFDPKFPKKTWDSLQRANVPNESKFLGADPGLLARFVVFGSLQGGGGVAWDRDGKRIWYESDGELHETLWALNDFYEAALREVNGLPSADGEVQQ